MVFPHQSETGVGRAILSNKKSYSIERSVRRQVILAIAAVTTIVFGLLYFLAARHLQTQFDAVLLARAAGIVSLVDQDQDGVDSDFSEDILTEYSPQADEPLYLHIRNPDGTDFIKSTSLGDGHLEQTTRLSPEDAPDIRNIVLPGGRAGRQIAMAFLPRLDEDEDGSAAPAAEGRPVLGLALARSRQDLDRILLLLALILTGSGLLLTAGLAIGIHRIVRDGLAPLRDGSRQIENLDPSDLSARVTLARTPDEMEPIVSELNLMLARVEQAFQRESRFSSDVAHELRTPLAELKSAAEVARTLKAGDPAVGQFFSDVQDIAEQMNHMVDVLTTLSHCENGTLDLPLEPLNLAGLVRQIVGEPGQQAAGSVKLALSDDIGVFSHGESLRIILRNLLSNAMQYSPPGSTIVCGAETAARTIRISVANSVTDLEASDLDRLFERFWQRDPSRTAAAHSGLGLPLVKALGEALGLRVDAVLRNGRLTITLSGLKPADGGRQPVVQEQSAVAAE